MNEIFHQKLPLPFTWTAHPAAERPITGIATIMVVIAAGFGAAIFMQSILWGFFAISVLFIGLIRFFLPTTYIIDSTGIREKFLGMERVASWRFFKRAIPVGRDVMLSPYPKRTFLDRFRAWQVHTPDEKTAKFIAEITEKKSRHSREE